MRLRRSFTTLSTVAIQAGRSQIVASVLQSGSLVHVQLVQVQPGLCEIGSNEEENHALILEQQQLLEKLKKHEPEALAVVEKKEAEPRRRDGRTAEQMKREEEELHDAMKASLSEGWSLLLHLLERRLEVLTLTSDFYRRALEFAVGIDRFEALRIEPGEDGLAEAQCSYDSVRRDVLGKSLQVLASSSILLQKLRQLQRTEALQRRGGVLQDEEAEDQSSQSSRSSRGPALRLEELVEELQDRRRRADQAVRLRLQQVERSITVQETQGESRGRHSDGWTLAERKILEQNLPSGSASADRESDSRSETRVLKPGSGSDRTRDVEPGCGSEDSRKFESGSGSDLQTEFRADQKPTTPSDETGNPDLELESSLDPQPKDLVQAGSERTEERHSASKPDVQPDPRLDLNPESSLDQTTDLKSGSRPDENENQPLGFRYFGSRDLQHGTSLDLLLEETRNFKPGSRSDLKPDSVPDETRDLKPRFKSVETTKSSSESKEVLESGSEMKPRSDEPRDLHSESTSGETEDLQTHSRPEETKESQSGSSSEVQPGTGSALRSESRSESKDQRPGTGSALRSESRSESKDQRPGTGSTLRSESGSESKDQRPGTGSALRSESGSESKDQRPGTGSALRSESGSESKDQRPGTGSDLRSESGSESKDQRPGTGSALRSESGSESKDQRPGTGSTLRSESGSESKDQRPGTGSDETRKLRVGSKPVETKESQSGFRSVLKHGSRSDVQTGPGSDVKPGSRSDVQTGSGSDVKPGSRSDVQTGPGSDVKPGSRSDVQTGPGSDVKPGSRSGETAEETGTLQSGSGSEVEDDGSSEASSEQDEPKQSSAAGAAGTCSWGGGQVADLQSMLGKDSPHGEDPAHRSLLTNQRQQLLLSFESLEKKVCSGLQQISSVLSNSSEAGEQLSEAEHTLNTHLQLHAEAQSAAQHVQNLNQILDGLRNLQHPPSTTGPPPHGDPSGPPPRGDPSGPPSPLKALTEQLKRGGSGTQTRTRTADLTSRVDLVLKELQSLSTKIESNLQLLQPFVSFLRAAQQVEEEMEELREMHRRRPGEEEEEEDGQTEAETCCQEALRRVLGAQELGNDCLRAVTMVSGSGLNLQAALSVLQQVMQRLDKTKQEVDELQAARRIRVQQQQEDVQFCRRYQDRLTKALQDLNCVSELLDSCTLMDLGSDLQTSKLQESFRRARPHFSQLDDEVEDMGRSWGSLRGVQDRVEEGGAVREEDLSELQKLHHTVKQKIQQSESILERTSSFHHTAQQLEVTLRSEPTDPPTGSTGPCRSAEAQQQIQNLLRTTSTLKTDICTAVTHSGWTGFQVEQLDARLRSLDSLCGSWLNEAARREEKLRREQLTRLLHGDISQLHNSFKELKRRFSNTKFNYLKRNDRTRNMKAVRNQLQQVELYEEKLQALRKRVHGATARLGLEVKDGGVARQVEDAANELHRQMGEFERSVCEHQKTLDMTCRLQQAMEEYQFWCEEASATIARVGKFSLECRSTEAVSVLYRQFEKFVWPTVPQQEERISQITELAVRLHGVEEGRRYIEKTVGKHSEMVASIRELSDGLMELEAKLKLDNLKQNDEEKEIKEMEEKKKTKEKRKMKKKKEEDNCSTQETADMYELKETGHTPELTAEHDRKEAPVRKQAAANRKPPLQKSSSQDTDRQEVQSESRLGQTQREIFTSSYSSHHTLSISCSPVEADRKLHAVHSRSPPVAAEPQAGPSPSVIGPSFSDIQKEFQKKEMQEKGQRAASTSCGSNTIPPQNASAEAEFRQQEAMTEDSLSNDEYECVSPDDISLPPLAETPESNMFQSDVEESFCFSSHSVHISQYSHQDQAQAEQAGTGAATGAIPQKSTQRESCPTPSISLHSSTRFGSESSPRLFTSTLCTILRTTETTSGSFPRGADLSLNNSESRKPCGSNPVHQNSTKDDSLHQSVSTPRAKGPNPDLHSSNTPVGDAELHKCNFDCPQSKTVNPENIGLTQSLHRDIGSVQNLREASPQRSSTSLITQQTACCQSSPAEGSQPDRRDPQPNTARNIGTSSRFPSREGPQTAKPLPESLTSTRAQQCVHGPGMSPGSPARSAAPPQPEAQTQALAQQSNPHVPPPSSSPHLLTPNQDPDICLPTAIREEIRLTPQIQGPPLLPPPPLARAESLPQGKASRPGPPCFTRPLSQATVMEGSPVTLEVEVTGHPEPTLTWFKDGEPSASTTRLAPCCDQRKRPLFLPEAADPEAAPRHHPQRAAADSSGGDKWLVAEVCDIISVDFPTWFGTLCVLLWLLYLMLL